MFAAVFLRPVPLQSMVGRSILGAHHRLQHLENVLHQKMHHLLPSPHLIFSLQLQWSETGLTLTRQKRKRRMKMKSSLHLIQGWLWRDRSGLFLVWTYQVRLSGNPVRHLAPMTLVLTFGWLISPTQLSVVVPLSIVGQIVVSWQVWTALKGFWQKFLQKKMIFDCDIIG